MNYQLKKGVNLHVVPTKKYKTIRVMIRFGTDLSVEKINQRTLLSSLLETNSKKYPSQQEMNEFLADLYGTSFGAAVGRKGDRHYLSVVLNTVNEKYLASKEPVLKIAFDFINEVIFHPNVKNGKFDDETFNREKENLVEYISSVNDDKQSQAALKVQKLYFEDSLEQGMASFGSSSGVAALTADALYSYYQEMLELDEIDIFVLGDVDPLEVRELSKVFGFTDREEISGSGLYKTRNIREVIEKTDELPVSQAKLNLAYQTGVFYHEKDYFPLIVFNGLFGGFPHSKLFMNVREKESMAYYASSSLDTFRGFLTVQTGIESKNKNKVVDLITVQLDSLIAGEITAEELSQTKEMLKNQYVSSLDNPASVLESEFIKIKYPQSDITQSKWMEQVESVTTADVADIARKIKLQIVYFMKGEE
ncbi:insulinase family protein [Vagococcus coleopterorum]|uniref:Insulinase family protein n=1 Tax=Vagococcus coleopterorum TaxID=2714946 RepID=A0A6G8ALN7_9ENTE|nr:pitrilysin family protein [Vagococcus coleopterorum]QIL45907.1 insulinase family protein [Vagococcus coleopterorum]